jgi:hypothetical protein
VGIINIPPVIGPGDSVVWRPTTNANGLATPAFRIKPTDLTNDGTEVVINVDVGPYNTPPTNLSYFNYTGATRYPNQKYFEITHASLLTNLAVTDVENAGSLIKFQIDELLGGQGLYVQTSGSCATLPATSSYFPQTTLLTTGQSLCWIQPSAVIGTYSALRVTPIDNDNAIGLTQATIAVSISVGTDIVPTYYGSHVATPYNVVKNAGTITWTYEQLRNLAGAHDTDSSAVSLVITYIGTDYVSATKGTLRKNGADVAVWTGTLGTSYSSNPPTSSMVIAPGESITFQSANNIGGSPTPPLFRFAAMDSTSVAAADREVKVNLVNGTGQNPTFGYVGPILIGSKTQGVTVQIPYDQYRLYADAHDIDEPATYGLKFKIMSTTTTNGTVQINKAGAACSAITNGTTLFEPGDFICFTPNATGEALAKDAIHSIMTARPLNYSDNADPALTAIGLQIRMP